jgi:DNA-binding response OmpR family regulator
MKILIVEDESSMGSFLAKELQAVSYSTKWVQTCATAATALASNPYDAIVLDIGLPDGDGLGLLRQWRSSGFNEPVIILSARDAVQDRVSGLNLGADDYLAKPFSFDELLARLRSLFRRQVGPKATIYEHRDLKFDLLSRRVQLNGNLIDLSTREYALLEIMMQNQGRIVTRSMIAEKVWETQDELTDNLIDVYMRRLRNKLDVNPRQPLFKTIRGIGYQLI